MILFIPYSLSPLPSVSSTGDTQEGGERETTCSRVGCLRHFVYSKFRTFWMFFFVSYTIRKWPKFRKIRRNFVCKSIQDSAVFWDILWLVIQNFLLIQHRRHFLHTAEKLQDADCGWRRYDSTPLNPYPFTAARWLISRPQNSKVAM